MQYRRFRAPDGLYLDALLTADGEFSVEAAQHAADHEAGYGIVPLVVVEADSDPWDGKAELHHRAPRPIPPKPKTFEQLVAEATSFDDLKALMIANARP